MNYLELSNFIGILKVMLGSYKIISIVIISQFVVRLGVGTIDLDNCSIQCCQKEQTSCCGENEKSQCPMGMIDCNESFFPTLFYNSHGTTDYKQDLKTNIQELITFNKRNIELDHVHNHYLTPPKYSLTYIRPLLC